MWTFDSMETKTTTYEKHIEKHIEKNKKNMDDCILLQVGTKMYPNWCLFSFSVGFFFSEFLDHHLWGHKVRVKKGSAWFGHE